jgi:1-acyl-sn-glycerol-3-phosphate acyltransferase
MFAMRLLSVYGFIIFNIVFILFFPAYLLMMYIPAWAKFSYKWDRAWAFIFFRCLGFKMEIEGTQLLDKDQPYVCVANHFSYLDIAVMGLMDIPYAFVGKSSITKVPLFGWMFRRLHIPVNRGNSKSRFMAVELAKAMVDKGRSVVFFPEGGIVSKHPPTMTAFKDGAFRTAIEKQIPVVPVSLPYNWIILPDDGSFMFHSRSIKMVIHPPIHTQGLGMDKLDEIKRMAYETIQNELDQYSYENNKGNYQQNRPSVAIGDQ